VNSAWDQKKLEARKMLEKVADSQLPVHAVLGGVLLLKTDISDQILREMIQIRKNRSS